MNDKITVFSETFTRFIPGLNRFHSGNNTDKWYPLPPAGFFVTSKERVSARDGRDTFFVLLGTCQKMAGGGEGRGRVNFSEGIKKKTFKEGD